MNLANVSQAHANAARQRHCAQDPTPSPQRRAHLRQVYPTKDGPVEDGPSLDIDIIAIHGLDTNSEKTWTWRGNGRKVNWLVHPDMLPSKVKRVRIFTYDWPADLMQPSDLVQKTQDEFATLLFEEILRTTRDHATSGGRPILFIASCLGGIILMKALVGAGPTYQSVRRATRGIVFLATPFRGTSFQDVAALAEPGLNAWAWIRGREVIKLLTIVKEPTFDLVQLVQDFTSLCQDKDYPCQVSTFYEKGKTSLPSKVFPCLPAWLRQEKLLVDASSAALDIVPHPLPLSRPHILMNKFAHSECTAECKNGCTESKDFGLVSGKIVEMLQKIREGSPLEQADAWIRTEHYTADKLKIERLSGKPLPMDKCYINFAIIEQPGEIWVRSEKRSKGDSATQSSPFSRSARLKVGTPDKEVRVELPALFDPRKRGDVETKPRRILIRGRAGVGKTTLCKKIVSEFTNGTWSQWSELFDRVLWVPLRHLKLNERRQVAGYTFFHLFSHEYFSLPNDRPDLARALSDTLKTESSRTLFVLDGLDEVSQDLSSQDDMFRFVKELLNQPNVIITSRPTGELPADLHAIDIELETIGFYPNQVNEYLKRTFSAQANEVRSFLQSRLLIQDLMRIPILLDALCFTWNEDLVSKMKFDTMTAVYRVIEDSLWKKDILRLGKTHDGKPITDSMIQKCNPSEIECLVKDEIYILESFAFIGLHRDIIDFESTLIPTHFRPPTMTLLDKTLSCLSFLRTSDLSLEHRSRSYHFLHLTFQEYFAARYFVRQWKARQPLNCLQFSGECNKIEPVTLLQEQKYDPRYDIFWRFVAGLLDADGEALGFFQAIEKEPRDLLGPTHQRLVMHCLSEVSTKMPLRKDLEEKLLLWLYFECGYMKLSRLAREVEFPEPTLDTALREGSDDVKITILQSLERRSIPSSIIKLAASWLGDDISKRLKRSVCSMLQSSHEYLKNDVLQAIVAQLENEDEDVRRAAVKALSSQPSMSEEILQAIVARLGDEDEYVRRAAAEALSRQPSMSEEILQAIVARLGDEDKYVRWAAVKALSRQPSMSEEILQAIVARLGDEDEGARQAAAEALSSQPSMSEEILQAVALLLESEKASELVEAILRKHKEFYSTLLNGPFAKSLYQILLRRSFKEHWSWYVEDGMSCVNMPDGVRKALIDNQQAFKDMINEARPADIPPINNKVFNVDKY
ncbi:MAG: hypothetical protein M1839_005897, partial [Geoglossum umbratile]